MTAHVIRGNADRLPLPDNSVDLIVTSPPYFSLRSYLDNGQHYVGQVGDEQTPAEYLERLIACTAEWMRVLRPSGSIFCNLGDKYSGAQQQNTGQQSGEDGAAYWRKTDPKRTGIPNKSLMGLPWRYALRCVDQLGLILRAEVVWSKPNGLPESVTDRVRRSHEQVFHFTVQPRYYSAVDEVREPHVALEHFQRYGRGPKNTRVAVGSAADGSSGHDSQWMGEPHPLGKLPGSVWTIPTSPLSVPDHLGVDHFAAYPPELVRRIVLGWSPRGVCAVCGEGRRPVTDKRVVGGHLAPNARDYRRLANGEDSGGEHWKVIEGRSEVTITGYSCACPEPTAPTTPGVVLDPFGGTGTSSLVASCYGRTGISVDLSHDYSRLARWRTTDRGERARVLDQPKPRPEAEGQESLFDDLLIAPGQSTRPSGGLGYSEARGNRTCDACGYRTQYAKDYCDRCGAGRGGAA